MATTSARSRRYGTRRSVLSAEGVPAAVSAATLDTAPWCRPRPTMPTIAASVSSAITRSMAGTGMRREAPQAMSPPATPPTDAPKLIRPTTLFAVYGSKRSLMSDQKPERRVPPKSDRCRYTATAATLGAARHRSHSSRSSTLDRPAATGRTRNGDRRASAHDSAPTARTDAAEDAIITAGKKATGNVERKSASRVARPAVCWAMSRALTRVAATTARRPSSSRRASFMPLPRPRRGRESGSATILRAHESAGGGDRRGRPAGVRSGAGAGLGRGLSYRRDGPGPGRQWAGGRSVSAGDRAAPRARAQHPDLRHQHRGALFPIPPPGRGLPGPRAARGGAGGAGEIRFVGRAGAGRRTREADHACPRGAGAAAARVTLAAAGHGPAGRSAHGAAGRRRAHADLHSRGGSLRAGVGPRDASPARAVPSGTRRRPGNAAAAGA